MVQQWLSEEHAMATEDVPISKHSNNYDNSLLIIHYYRSFTFVEV